MLYLFAHNTRVRGLGCARSKPEARLKATMKHIRLCITYNCLLCNIAFIFALGLLPVDKPKCYYGKLDSDYCSVHICVFICCKGTVLEHLSCSTTVHTHPSSIQVVCVITNRMVPQMLRPADSPSIVTEPTRNLVTRVLVIVDFSIIYTARQLGFFPIRYAAVAY